MFSFNLLFKPILSLFVILTLLTSCSQLADNTATEYPYKNSQYTLPQGSLNLNIYQNTPESHQKYIQKLQIQTIPKQNTWEGKWVFVVQKKDRRLSPFLLSMSGISKVKGQWKPVNYIDLKKIPANEIVYVGFTSLSKDEKGNLAGFDIITNDNNYKAPLVNTKSQENRLEWDFMGRKGGMFSGGDFKTIAIYDKNKDILNGKTFVRAEIPAFVDRKKSVFVVLKKPEMIPSVTYLWTATRISDADFAKFTQFGKVNNGIPLFVLGMNINDPNLEYEIKKALKIH